MLRAVIVCIVAILLPFAWQSPTAKTSLPVLCHPDQSPVACIANITSHHQCIVSKMATEYGVANVEGLCNPRLSPIVYVTYITAQLQQMARNCSQLHDVTEKVLQQLHGFGDVLTDMNTPCAFFANLFQTLCCAIKALAQSALNPVVRVLLHYMDFYEVFFDYARFVFCPDGAAGGGTANKLCAQSAGDPVNWGPQFATD